jgi:transcriptional regulator with XRE-family HTH domain
MPVTRHVIVVDNSAVARRVGGRIREARIRAGLTQAEVAKGRYTAAYISALERGLAKPSMAALTFISERLGVAVRDLVSEDEPSAGRLEADIMLAAGRHLEALDRYDALLADATDRRLRAELLRGKAEALCRLHRGGEAIGPASEAAESFAAIGLDADAALANYWLSYAHYQEDNPAEARGLLLELLAQERAGLHVAPDFRFRLLTSLGHVEAWDGEPERALTYMEEAKSLTEGLSLMQRAAFLSGLALQYSQTGDLERSIRAGTESLALYRLADSRRDEASLENNLAMTYLRLNNTERAAQHLARARDLVTEEGDAQLDAHIAETEARLAWARGDADAAEDRIDAVLRAAEAGGSFVAAAGAHLTRARIAKARGDASRAGTSFGDAASVLREHGARARLREVLAEWAEYMSEAGDLASANRLYAEALGRAAADRAGRRSQVGTGAGER